jgi:hypothetical protein
MEFIVGVPRMGVIPPAPPSRRSGVGVRTSGDRLPQGITEEARRSSGIQALAIGGLRFPFALGQVVLLSAAAVGGGE